MTQYDEILVELGKDLLLTTGSRYRVYLYLIRVLTLARLHVGRKGY